MNNIIPIYSEENKQYFIQRLPNTRLKSAVIKSPNDIFLDYHTEPYSLKELGCRSTAIYWQDEEASDVLVKTLPLRLGVDIPLMSLTRNAETDKAFLTFDDDKINFPSIKEIVFAQMQDGQVLRYRTIYPKNQDGIAFQFEFPSVYVEGEETLLDLHVYSSLRCLKDLQPDSLLHQTGMSIDGTFNYDTGVIRVDVVVDNPNEHWMPVGFVIAGTRRSDARFNLIRDKIMARYEKLNTETRTDKVDTPQKPPREMTIAEAERLRQDYSPRSTPSVWQKISRFFRSIG